MSDLFTASQMYEAYCKASGLNPKDHVSILNRFRYLSKRGLLGDGTIVDDRKTLAFPKIEVFRAAIYTELAGLAMDLRAFKPIVEAAEREYPGEKSVPPSLQGDGGRVSKGGLLDAINGIAQGESWTLHIKLLRSGTSVDGRIKASFVCDDVAQLEAVSEVSNDILGRQESITRASIDLTDLFGLLIKIVGLPDDDGLRHPKLNSKWAQK